MEKIGDMTKNSTSLELPYRLSGKETELRRSLSPVLLPFT